MNFAQNLKSELNNSGKSMYWLSKKLDVHPTTVSNWVNGKTEPKGDMLLKIANLLEVEIDYLMGVDSATHNKRQPEYYKGPDGVVRINLNIDYKHKQRIHELWVKKLDKGLTDEEEKELARLNSEADEQFEQFNSIPQVQQIIETLDGKSPEELDRALRVLQGMFYNTDTTPDKESV